MGIWSRIKRVALTDVRVLVRGMERAELEAFERALIESDLDGRVAKAVRAAAVLGTLSETEADAMRQTVRTLRSAGADRYYRTTG